MITFNHISAKWPAECLVLFGQVAGTHRYTSDFLPLIGPTSPSTRILKPGINNLLAVIDTKYVRAQTQSLSRHTFMSLKNPTIIYILNVYIIRKSV